MALYIKLYLDPELPVNVKPHPTKKAPLETGDNAPKIQKGVSHPLALSCNSLTMSNVLMVVVQTLGRRACHRDQEIRRARQGQVGHPRQGRAALCVERKDAQGLREDGRSVVGCAVPIGTAGSDVKLRMTLLNWFNRCRATRTTTAWWASTSSWSSTPRSWSASPARSTPSCRCTSPRNKFWALYRIKILFTKLAIIFCGLQSVTGIHWTKVVLIIGSVLNIYYCIQSNSMEHHSILSIIDIDDILLRIFGAVIQFCPSAVGSVLLVNKKWVTVGLFIIKI